ISFRQLGFPVADKLHLVFVPDVENAAQQWNAEARPNSLRLANAFVDLIEQENHSCREERAAHNRKEQVYEQLGRGGNLRHACKVDDRDVVRRDSCNADFLEALQQALIELPVGIHLALENVVLDAVLLLDPQVALQALDAATQFVLA